MVERVILRRLGNRPPVDLSDPAFVEVGGNGDRLTGDDLDLPLSFTEEL